MLLFSIPFGIVLEAIIFHVEESECVEKGLEGLSVV